MLDCVNPLLVAAAQAVPPPPEPPNDPLDRMEWFAERRGQFEQDDLARYAADGLPDPRELALSDPEFAARFGARLYGRLTQSYRCECGRGHRHFDTKPVDHSDSGKSSAYSSSSGHGTIEGQTKGVQWRDSVDAEGRFWRCLQTYQRKVHWFRETEFWVEWQCVPLPLNEAVARRAFQAFFERPPGPR